MCPADKKLTISDLPDDMLCEVFDRLEVKQVLAIQTVNKDFHRCAKKWLPTVNSLIIIRYEFVLRKSCDKKDTDWVMSDEIEKTEQTLFPALKTMLTTCTGIKIVSIWSLQSLTTPQLIQLISCCPTISLFDLTLHGLNSCEDDWICLIGWLSKIEHFDVRLTVRNLSPDVFSHLKLLFKIAKQIKTVIFLNPSNSILKTIAFLDESVRVEIDFDDGDGDDFLYLDDQTRDLISQRVEYLFINSNELQALSIRRFEMLSQLIIILNSSNLVIPTVAFPRLKHLEINSVSKNNPDTIWSFFSAVRPLNQLEQLDLDNFIYDVSEDEHLSEMLKKASKMKMIKFTLYRSKFSPAVEKLFRLLAQLSTRLQIVELKIKLPELIADEFGRLIECLAEFAERRTETKLMLTCFDGTKEQQSAFAKSRLSTRLSKNVYICWD